MDNIIQANYIGHCPLSKPHPGFITKNHTFPGNTESTAIARHIQCLLGFPLLGGKVLVAT